MKPHNIGGSLLPSSSPQILTPITTKIGKLQVVQDFDADTHILKLDGAEIARHPNGFSCHSLAERIASGDTRRVLEQADYIVRCGGVVDFEILKRKEAIMKKM